MTTETTTEDTAEAQPAREAAARSTIKYYAAWSFGAGLVAIPMVELLLVTGVQIQMVRKLSEIYGVKFGDSGIRNSVMALLGGLAAETLAVGIGLPLARAIPGIGQILSLLTMPAFATASTCAVGEVYLQHFEKGGTLLDFRPSAVKEKFRRVYDAAAAAARA